MPIWLLKNMSEKFWLNSKHVDPDQTAPKGAVWSGSTLFAQVLLPKYLQYTGCIDN